MDLNQHNPRSAHFATSDIGSLLNKVAVVTGGSSGIGRAIIQAFAKAGAFVVSADLKPNPPNVIDAGTMPTEIDSIPTAELANKLWPSNTENKPRAIFVKCNVSIESDVEGAVQAAVNTYGRVDIMVNNAGISAETTSDQFNEGGQSVRRIHETDVSVLDRTFAVNIKGVWLGCKHAAKQMLLQPPHESGDRGWIINLSSIMGSVGLPGSSSYCGSKGAVIQFTRAIALDYAADKIHVNCIQPGFVETTINDGAKAKRGKEAVEKWMSSTTPWGRIGLPEEVAEMAVFLAGPGARWITGSIFAVDGGYMAQ